MSTVTASLKCFKCKELKTVDLAPEHFTLTKNGRHVANYPCKDCGRKITSLVSNATWSKLGSAEPEKVKENAEFIAAVSSK